MSKRARLGRSRWIVERLIWCATVCALAHCGGRVSTDLSSGNTASLGAVGVLVNARVR